MSWLDAEIGVLCATRLQVIVMATIKSGLRIYCIGFAEAQQQERHEMRMYVIQ